MDEAQRRALHVATTAVGSFCDESAEALNPEDRQALQDALEVLAGFSGRAVTQAFIDWFRCGQPRRRPGRVLNVVPAERSERPRLAPLNLRSSGA